MARDMCSEHASLDRTLEVTTRAALDLIPGAEHADVTVAVRGGGLESRAGTSGLSSWDFVPVVGTGRFLDIRVNSYCPGD